LFWALANRILRIFPSTPSNGLPIILMAAPALSRVLVDAELLLAGNSSLGVPYNPEIEDELKNESIDVDGLTKPLYQFMGE
jgi:hypothetical protein